MHRYLIVGAALCLCSCQHQAAMVERAADTSVSTFAKTEESCPIVTDRVELSVLDAYVPNSGIPLEERARIAWTLLALGQAPLTTEAGRPVDGGAVDQRVFRVTYTVRKRLSSLLVNLNGDTCLAAASQVNVLPEGCTLSTLPQRPTLAMAICQALVNHLDRADPWHRSPDKPLSMPGMCEQGAWIVEGVQGGIYRVIEDICDTDPLVSEVGDEWMKVQYKLIH